jgi:hypothetical protein
MRIADTMEAWLLAEHPSLLGLRGDKNAVDVAREVPMA